MQIKNLKDQIIEVRGKLLGGSTKLGFLNAHGLPQREILMNKTPHVHKFLEQNTLSTFIETGCSTHLPKTGDRDY